MLFYPTSTNSGAMIMPNFSSTISDPPQDGAKWRRVLWTILTVVLIIAMLMAGGVTTMEYATLIFALPLTIIAWPAWLHSRILQVAGIKFSSAASAHLVGGRP